jgi:hypothetical protein
MGEDEDSIVLCGTGTKRHKEKYRTASSKNKISFGSVVRRQQRITVYPETSWESAGLFIDTGTNLAIANLM